MGTDAAAEAVARGSSLAEHDLNGGGSMASRTRASKNKKNGRRRKNLRFVLSLSSANLQGRHQAARLFYRGNACIFCLLLLFIARK